MTRKPLFLVLSALLCGTGLGFVCEGISWAQPSPTCGPGSACKASSFTATKNTGADYTLTGDAGVRFGDGTIQNTAAAGGLSATGSPLQVTYFADGGWLKGNANFQFDPVGKSVNAGVGTNIVLGDGGMFCASVSCGSNFTDNFGQAILNTGSGTNMQLRTETAQRVEVYYALMAGQQLSNRLTFNGAGIGSPVTITATGAVDSDVSIVLGTKGNGKLLVGGTGGAYMFDNGGAGNMQISTAPGATLELQKNTNTGDLVSATWGLLTGNGRSNQLTVDGSSSTNPVTLTAAGGDTNISINAVTKGTGQFTVNSQGVNTVGYAPKAASSFTDFEHVAGTVPTLTDGTTNNLIFSAGADNNAGVPKISGFVESLSNASMYVEVAANVASSTALGTANSYYSVAAVMRESGTGKVASLSLFTDAHTANTTPMFIMCEYWLNAGVRTSANGFAVPFTNGGPIFLKLTRSSTNILYQISVDRGATYQTLQTTATATAFTTAPDQVGFGANLNATTDSIVAHIVDYRSGF